MRLLMLTEVFVFDGCLMKGGNYGAKFSGVFREGRGNVNAHKLRKRKPNTGKGTTNLNNPVDLPVVANQRVSVQIAKNCQKSLTSIFDFSSFRLILLVV